MGPLVQKQFELRDKLGSGDLLTSGLTQRLLTTAGQLLNTRVSLSEITNAHVSVIGKTQFSEPTLCFSITRETGSSRHVANLQIAIPENTIPPRERNALWRAVPSLAPGGASILGFHFPVDSVGTLQAESELSLSLPKDMRPLALRHPELRHVGEQSLTLKSLISAARCDQNLEFGLAFTKGQLPLDLCTTLRTPRAPDGSVGSCLDYVEKNISHLAICSSMSTIDWNGCWRAVGSATILAGKEEEPNGRHGIILVSLRQDLFGQGENRLRPRLEVMDLIVNAAAKVEAAIHPEVLHDVAAVPGGRLRQIEAFATRRQLVAIQSLHEAYSKILPDTDDHMVFLQSRLETVSTRLSTLLGPAAAS